MGRKTNAGINSTDNQSNHKEIDGKPDDFNRFRLTTSIVLGQNKSATTWRAEAKNLNQRHEHIAELNKNKRIRDLSFFWL